MVIAHQKQNRSRIEAEKRPRPSLLPNRGFSLAPKLHQKHIKKPLVRYVWRVVFAEFFPKKGELGEIPFCPLLPPFCHIKLTV